MSVDPPRSDAQARRRLLKLSACSPLALALAWSPRAGAAAPRSLDFYHTHTDERLRVVYHEAGRYVPESLAALNHLLRDFRTGEVTEIDARLFDTLHALNVAVGDGTFEIISGYRSPRTNAMLRAASDGVATRSLHLQGRAIDIRLSGRDTRRLRDAAAALANGGVGYYARSDFVHLDTGRVRRW
jgi:uncharacterized protein YcbK (DUF882 family)